MGKLYTVDGKLLTDAPEVRVGETVYKVDDRVKTVKKLMALSQASETMGMDILDKTIVLGLGEKAYKEIDKLNLSFRAYQSLYENVVAAMTGEEKVTSSDRFQESK